jgi:hypothetical protein
MRRACVSDSWTDPGSLEGDALTQWYLKSPADVDRERQDAAARRYRDFFYGGPGDDPDPEFNGEVLASSRDIDPGFAMPAPDASEEIDPGFTWVAAGPNRFRSVRVGTDRPYGGPRAAGQDSVIEQYPDAGASDPAASESDLTPQPIMQPVGELRRPPAVAFGPAPPVAAQFAPRAPSFGRVRPQVTPTPGPAANPGHAPASGPPPGRTIAYGALRAPAPSDQELAELRRQQAAFSDTTRKIDLQNSWFAAPVLAAPLAVMGLEGAAAWAARSALPEAEQAALQFVERDPYLRVGDNWATRAGRRAHAALKERLAQKPGWEYEPKLPREGQRPLKPDMGTPKRDPIDPTKRKYIEYKPDSPSGRAAGARALQKYRDVTRDPVRLLFYNLKDFI